MHVRLVVYSYYDHIGGMLNQSSVVGTMCVAFNCHLA